MPLAPGPEAPAEGGLSSPAPRGTPALLGGGVATQVGCGERAGGVLYREDAQPGAPVPSPGLTSPPGDSGTGYGASARRPEDKALHPPAPPPRLGKTKELSRRNGVLQIKVYIWWEVLFCEKTE